jgi:N-acetylmuramoyl-L-alanine amidase
MKKYLILIILLIYIIKPIHGFSIAYLKNIRYFTYNDYTRVVIDLSSQIEVTEKILPGQEKTRLYFDMQRSQFAPEYPSEKKREITIGKKHLQRIRIGKRSKHCVRVVFDFNNIEKYTKFYLTSPFRIVFDVFQKESTGSEKVDLGEPAKSVEGKYSVVRQLGLGVHTIVIDPGHGGKDPGTANKKLRLYEKDITLDLAKRVKTAFQKNTKYNIILTRNDDRYIALEERTAIANSKNGDLFISIHLNSAPRKSARGVEAYFLSMTTDPWAMQVAAQENAVTSKSIGEMESIIEQIVRHTKISESKIFTTHIVENLVRQLKTEYKDIENLGVKKAPFFVLAGAQMPASLVEVSFLSHNQEARRLRSTAYRNALAQGLYKGIISYIKSLGKQ